MHYHVSQSQVSVVVVLFTFLPSLPIFSPLSPTSDNSQFVVCIYEFVLDVT